MPDPPVELDQETMIRVSDVTSGSDTGGELPHRGREAVGAFHVMEIAPFERTLNADNHVPEHFQHQATVPERGKLLGLEPHSFSGGAPGPYGAGQYPHRLRFGDHAAQFESGPLNLQAWRTAGAEPLTPPESPRS